jgi:hypothetical protein
LTIQSPPGDGVSPAPKTLARQYVNVVSELAGMRGAHVQLRESDYWKDLLRSIAGIENGYYRTILEKNGVARVEKALGDSSLPFHISHGDVAPWNAYLSGQKLFLYDWEYSHEQRPPGWDLFHFNFQINSFLKKSKPVELTSRVLNDSYNSLTKTYWEKLGVVKDMLPDLFLLYVLERFSFAASEGNAGFEELGRLSKIVLILSGDR